MEIEKLKKRKDVKTESPIEELLLAEFHKAGLYPETQYWIENYRVDFVFPKDMLVVEADGWEHHKDRLEEDKKRQNFLEENGWKVLRFWGKDIIKQSDEIIKAIIEHKTFESRTDKKEGFVEPLEIHPTMEMWEIEERKTCYELQNEEYDNSVLESLKKGWKTIGDNYD